LIYRDYAGTVCGSSQLAASGFPNNVCIDTSDGSYINSVKYVYPAVNLYNTADCSGAINATYVEDECATDDDYPAFSYNAYLTSAGIPTIGYSGIAVIISCAVSAFLTMF
jgi:hypothetical protein